MGDLIPAKTRIDVNAKKSDRKGFRGLIETIMRRFTPIFHGLVLMPLYLLASLCAGVSLIPSFHFYHWVFALTESWPSTFRFFALGTSLGIAYFLYGFTALFVLPAVNFVCRGKLKAWRGSYYSFETISWYIHNSTTYLLRYTFLEFFTPSPFNLWFYRMMGMKIGEGTVINTVHISDPSLIEIGSKVTIGGSVTIVAHYGQGGFLVLAPVKIGDQVTIGLRATIMGGVTIGAKAKILPNSAVLPGTVIPEGETWGGVPAQKYSVFKKAA